VNAKRRIRRRNFFKLGKRRVARPAQSANMFSKGFVRRNFILFKKWFFTKLQDMKSFGFPTHKISPHPLGCGSDQCHRYIGFTKIPLALWGVGVTSGIVTLALLKLPSPAGVWE